MSHRKMSLLADMIGVLSIVLIVSLSLNMFLPILTFGTDEEKAKVVDLQSSVKEMPLLQIEETPEPVFECVGEFVVTAYCSCEECCEEYAKNRPLDKDGNEIVYGAAMIPLKEGVSIAADTSIFPFGTVLFIDGNKYIVQDRGGDIKGKRLDLYFANHAVADIYGRQTKKVYVERAVKNENYDRESKNQISISYNCSDY